MNDDAPALYFDKDPVESVADLLQRFGKGAFTSPFRSTIPLVALVKDDYEIFTRIVTECGSGASFATHFEYKVEVPGVIGNPSQTDAMILSPNLALALEAKWTEPRYETVAKRLKNRVARLTLADPERSAEEHEAQQRAVICAWLDMLGGRLERRIQFDDASGIIYQAVHRAASACSASRPPALVYLHFEPSPAKGAATSAQYRADLRRLQTLVGVAAPFPIYLVTVPLRLTDAFREIAILPKRSSDTSRQVKRAIASLRLFDFEDPVVERITPDFAA
jgi:hypothetical protein